MKKGEIYLEIGFLSLTRRRLDFFNLLNYFYVDRPVETVEKKVNCLRDMTCSFQKLWKTCGKAAEYDRPF
ncbi:hypothetical protein QT970_20545 [Microcoleus sp. herbarium8]|uniref:hypothetical protein n=1 Tax=unclassified Microcoleus TaxID=2642155 RepID=UPI002FD6DB06